MEKKLIFSLLFALLTTINASGQLGPTTKMVDSKCAAVGGAKPNATIFDRWINEVWHQGRLDLVKELVGPTYLRHEASGTRSVTPEQYREEISAARTRLPDIRFVVHDCNAIGDRIWTRWTMVGKEPSSGQAVRRMGTQIYRVANGRLVETWMLMYPTDSAWTETRDAEKAGPTPSPAVVN